MLINGNSRELEKEKTIKVVSSPFTRKLRKLMYLAGLLTFPDYKHLPISMNIDSGFLFIIQCRQTTSGLQLRG